MLINQFPLYTMRENVLYSCQYNGCFYSNCQFSITFIQQLLAYMPNVIFQHCSNNLLAYQIFKKYMH